MIGICNKQPRVKFYNFEPDPLAFKALQANCELEINAIAINYGLGNKMGKSEFFLILLKVLC